MAVVEGVFADQVQVDPAQRHRAPARAGEGGVERRPGDRPPAEFPLANERGDVGLGAAGVEVLEGSVRPVGPRVEAVQVLAAEAPPDPGPLDVGDVAHQPEQRQARGRHRPERQLLAGEPGTDVQQRRPLPLEEAVEHRALVAGERLVDAHYLGRGPGHRSHPPAGGIAESLAARTLLAGRWAARGARPPADIARSWRICLASATGSWRS
ncbi:MAG TPA: hypothetical protein VFL91_18380 [Thermomicrobiales bacterium]|nr:hypothetical protein [Thermomicrobiales bacterium]